MATIYRTTTNGYDEFKLPFMEMGRRKFHRFGDYAGAMEKGNAMLESMSKGHGDSIVLTGADKHSFIKARDAVKPLGIPLELAAMQFAEVVKLLGEVPVIEAARDYVKRNSQKRPDMLVAKVVEEYIADKEARKLSTRYIEDLRYRLGRFKAAFQVNIARVDGPQLAAFLDALVVKEEDKKNRKASPRSFNNFRSTLISLFEYAKRRKYLPADWNEFEAIGEVKDNGGEIEIFSPEELAALLTHADDQLIPFLAIGAFAGLRSAEIDRLDWRDVKFQTGYIVIEEQGQDRGAARGADE
jgi:integrase